jgi:hypothetical protein
MIAAEPIVTETVTLIPDSEPEVLQPPPIEVQVEPEPSFVQTAHPSPSSGVNEPLPIGEETTEMAMPVIPRRIEDHPTQSPWMPPQPETPPEMSLAMPEPAVVYPILADPIPADSSSVDATPESAKPRDSEIVQRLAALTRKIERYPDYPVNYVLRGELLIEIGNPAKALEDFRKAIALSEQHDPDLDWGYLNSAFLDRAHRGVREILP